MIEFSNEQSDPQLELHLVENWLAQAWRSPARKAMPPTERLMVEIALECIGAFVREVRSGGWTEERRQSIREGIGMLKVSFKMAEVSMALVAMLRGEDMEGNRIKVVEGRKEIELLQQEQGYVEAKERVMRGRNGL